MTVKLYTKGERVLRSEAIVHNAKALASKRSLPYFSDITGELAQILERFLNALHCVDCTFLPDGVLDELSQPGYIGESRIAGIDLAQVRHRSVMAAVIRLASSPKGFKISDLANHVRTLLGWSEARYQPRHASYDLRKLRAKGWVQKIGRSRRYDVTPDGLRIMTALLTLREKIIKPVLSGADKSRPGPKPKQLHQVDEKYRILQSEMLSLFNILGIATA